VLSFYKYKDVTEKKAAKKLVAGIKKTTLKNVITKSKKAIPVKKKAAKPALKK
jgi:hypothetical protein